jgi:hypothetical protein
LKARYEGSQMPKKGSTLSYNSPNGKESNRRNLEITIQFVIEF